MNNEDIQNIVKKYPNTPRGVDFVELAKTSKIDQLDFNKSLKYLLQMRNAITELEDLDYKEYLNDGEIEQINVVTNYLSDNFRERIVNFNLQDSNAHQIKDSLNSEINSIYTNQFSVSVRNSLTYLRQEFDNNKSTKDDYIKSVSNIKKIEKELKEKSDRITKDEISVQNRQAAVPSQLLAIEFDTSLTDLIRKEKQYSGGWGIIAKTFYGLTFLIVISATVYFCSRDGFLKDSSSKYEFGIIFFLLISLSFYLLKIFVRRQNILLHNIQLNSHRKNIAQTIQNFAESGSQDVELKNKLLEYGVSNMFIHDNTGYLNKDQMDTSLASPAVELIKTIKG